MSIAQTIYRYDIAAKISPVKDIFLVLFFVGLGMHIGVTGFMDHIGIFIFLLVCVIFVKPILTAFLYIYLDMTPTNSIKVAILL